MFADNNKKQGCNGKQNLASNRKFLGLRKMAREFRWNGAQHSEVLGLTLLI